MKKIFTFALILLTVCSALQAQTKFPQIDKSPMDMSYYPNAYPHLKIQDKLTEPLVARVIFSRPQKNGRAIFGELLEYGKVWRLGANEATEIEFFQKSLQMPLNFPFVFVRELLLLPHLYLGHI